MFFRDDDYQAYLAWLKGYAERYGVEIIAYYLMTNHIHLVLVPAAEEGLEKVLKPLHMRYAGLAEGDEPQRLEVLRRNVDKGLPCGSEKFIHKLEKLTGRALQYRPRGRPKQEIDDE